ncbi:SUMF1/EgtB/PvdO family nonheme iron enzyme [Trichocoleus sp. FACHB-591]|uniref:SUMF1/EgtB/PvdO family nonheme iron enzyme n=1 Tax=Trichocoleus sp. FACHB-591 TaxID=2692872 RepID=UPI0016845486|nr:SUMF1/EgtB/PvdO family nonheme iron enzyme [Trichocoleus sp. FACHB-591]MBD2095111.1 SUMF1/EgtB/PvdO family nonheme iron enzyme [Trichocoleus sp. FACHB-591]
MGKNFAICIGINQYDNMQPLHYAKRDAEAVRDYCLQDLGFEKVYYFSDDSPPIETDFGPPLRSGPTFGILSRFLRVRFEQRFLHPGDNFWFFFAGHGKRHRDRDYLMPLDADPGNTEGTGISIHHVTERLRRCGADNVILLLDACRNEGDRNGEGIGLETQQGVVTLFSCSPNERSYEIDELQHGAFTYTLLQGLRMQGEDNCATVERLYQYLRSQVPKLNNHYQKPRQIPYGHVEPLTKAHLILLPKQATPVDLRVLKTDALEAEVEQDWELAEQLWTRVLFVSPGDQQAIKAIKRVAVKAATTPTHNAPVAPSTASTLSRSTTAPIENLSSVTINPSVIQLAISTFEFDIVTVDAQGQQLTKQRGQAQYFIEDLGSGVMLEMVSIPSGAFKMGSPRGEQGRTKREGPQHGVKVQPFWMGRYSVTQAQWNVVSFLPTVDLELEANPAKFKGKTHPIECISWHEAVEFCNRLTRYTGREYRLPTEAEWEYACRAGTTTPFHFGETIRTDAVNYHGEYAYGYGSTGKYRRSTNAVTVFSCSNAFGLTDMHGNVSEWCQDVWHDYYNGAPTDGRAWLDGGDCTSRVIRGGSWTSDPIACRSAYRCQAKPDDRDSDLGFRVVVSIPSNIMTSQ